MTDALQILREMVAVGPTVRDDKWGNTYCLYCAGFDWDTPHDPDCPWLRGRRLIEKHDKATERRPLD